MLERPLVNETSDIDKSEHAQTYAEQPRPPPFANIKALELRGDSTGSRRQRGSLTGITGPSVLEPGRRASGIRGGTGRA